MIEIFIGSSDNPMRQTNEERSLPDADSHTDQ